MTEVAFKVDGEVIAALRNAVRDCSERGLSFASKWAAELLCSLPSSKRRPEPTIVAQSDFHTSTPARPRSPRPSLSFAAQTPAAIAPESVHPFSVNPNLADVSALPGQSPEILQQEAEWEAEDADHIAMARTFMDSKEYLRVIHWLRPCRSAKAAFLRVYSQYLESEKKALRDWYKLENTREQPPEPVNTSLHNLLELVRNATDPWLLFLKALFLCRMSRREEAIESAILSIAQYPWNWSTWAALGDCLSDGDELSSLLPLLPLPSNHPLVLMFQVKTLNSLNSPSDNELTLCDRLLSDDCFPRSMWIMALRGNVLYYLHDFTAAEAQFRKILAIDPYRVDDIDILSNILYVSENNNALSKLAHDYLAIDKDRPEICCIIGNYYSLRAEHEKAVKYFKRATQLDRSYLAAWTLMGHEFVEMKNSHAAIEAYRKAVDVNKKDYRAWYGLAQAYELLGMHQYALYYYQHATALRPYDVRIWQAQGMCYEEMGRLKEAAECLRRALIGADPQETTIHSKLAKLHHDLGEYAEAAAYHRRIVEVCRAAQKPIQEWSKSAVYVARYHILQGGGDLALARQYLEWVAVSNAEEVTQANELLRRHLPAAVMRQQQQQQQNTTNVPGRAASEGASFT
ncbi:TPR-like protein [Trametes coccinea BRFM310]|uniref:TPR-like protein n=1 Tax=Trametes coccinea (strain BRFM310) TaxID=1353009 RepID=A0A1Y2J060_TRAC3|nr:TPR-like protein [Trametes coccinea BRFM310]